MPGPEPAPAGGRLDDDDEVLFASVSSRGSQSDSLPDLMLVEHRCEETWKERRG